MQIPGLLQSVVRGFGRFHTMMLRAIGQRGPLGTATLILTTRGRKSGKEFSTPLLFVEENDNLYVVASFGGNDEPPGWYKNLVKTPEVGVEIGARAGRYRARSLEPAEAKPIWPRLLELYPSYASYQKRTTRVIPIVELAPLAGAPAR